MNLIEFLGFVFSILALLFMFIRRSMEDRRLKQYPEAEVREFKEHEEILKKYFNELTVEPEQEEEEEEAENDFLPPLASQPLPQPKEKAKRIVSDDYTITSAIDSRAFKTHVEQEKLKSSIDSYYQKPFARQVVSPDLAEHNEIDPYKITSHQQSSPIKQLVKTQGSLKNAVLLREVLGPPRGINPY